MAQITMKQLLEAGVHFGHQTKRWNPKMKPYIFGARNGIYIIDLQKTVRYFRTAYDFIKQVTENGDKVLFVGTKKQAQDSISEEAVRAGQYFVNNRWLGGMLTNFSTIKKSIDRLKKIEAMATDGPFNLITKKEGLQLERERIKLEKNLGGIKMMTKLPGAIFIIDPKKEAIAVNEARKLGVPVVAVVDSEYEVSLCLDHKCVNLIMINYRNFRKVCSVKVFSLKIIANIYRPSSGDMKIHGDISPFLELGVGFKADHDHQVKRQEGEEQHEDDVGMLGGAETETAHATRGAEGGALCAGDPPGHAGITGTGG